jgi:hypothetical protein
MNIYKSLRNDDFYRIFKEEIIDQMLDYLEDRYKNILKKNYNREIYLSERDKYDVLWYMNFIITIKLTNFGNNNEETSTDAEKLVNFAIGDILHGKDNGLTKKYKSSLSVIDHIPIKNILFLYSLNKEGNKGPFYSFLENYRKKENIKNLFIYFNEYDIWKIRLQTGRIYHMISTAFLNLYSFLSEYNTEWIKLYLEETKRTSEDLEKCIQNGMLINFDSKINIISIKSKPHDIIHLISDEKEFDGVIGTISKYSEYYDDQLCFQMNLVDNIPHGPFYINHQYLGKDNDINHFIFGHHEYKITYKHFVRKYNYLKDFLSTTIFKEAFLIIIKYLDRRLEENQLDYLSSIKESEKLQENKEFRKRTEIIKSLSSVKIF